jgi:predicted ester cyclase
MMRAAFPDLHYAVEDQIAEGDKVVTRYTASGTHQGELMGVAPTGSRVEIRGISITRIKGGKIEEIWESYDALGMMQQLGVVAFPA